MPLKDIVFHNILLLPLLCQTLNQRNGGDISLWVILFPKVFFNTLIIEILIVMYFSNYNFLFSMPPHSLIFCKLQQKYGCGKKSFTQSLCLSGQKLFNICSFKTHQNVKRLWKFCVLEMFFLLLLLNKGLSSLSKCLSSKEPTL